MVRRSKIDESVINWDYVNVGVWYVKALYVQAHTFRLNNGLDSRGNFLNSGHYCLVVFIRQIIKSIYLDFWNN